MKAFQHSCVLKAVTVILTFFVGVYSVPGGEWTIKPSLPSFIPFGAAAAQPNNVFYVSDTLTYRLQMGADAWAVLPSRPTATTEHAMEATLPGRTIVMGGSVASVATNAVHELKLSDEWTTLSPMPTSRARLCGASTGGIVWAMGGVNTTEVAEYSVSQDTWTTKASLPSPITGDGAYADGFVVVTGISTTAVYCVDTDQWTTASPSPVLQVGSIGRGTSYGSRMYFMGGFPFSSTLHQYTVVADTWTTLASSPSPHFRGPLAMANGTLIAMGGTGSTAVEIYNAVTPQSSASVWGDPVINTFNGAIHTVELWPGVFNILTTTALVVNALFDNSPTLPPDESMVVMVVGVVYVSPKTGKLVKCSCSALDGFTSSCVEPGERKAVSPPPEVRMMESNAGFVVTTPGVTVEVYFAHQSTVVLENGIHSVFPNSCFLNVRVHKAALFPTALPCHSDRSEHISCIKSTGLLHLSSPLREYEVEGGSVYDTHTVSSDGIFVGGVSE